MPPHLSGSAFEGEFQSPGSSPTHHGVNGPPSPLAAGPRTHFGFTRSSRGSGSPTSDTPGRAAKAAGYQVPSRPAQPQRKSKLQPRPVIARNLRDHVVATEEEATEKGVIAQLQEFVQGSKECPMPANCSILQWDYDDQRMVNQSLEFRAKVAFFLDGVPHHALGTWQSSKRGAKRDVAERALCLFVTRWGCSAGRDLETKGASDVAPESDARVAPGAGNLPLQAQDSAEAQALIAFCCSPPVLGQPVFVTSASPPRWSHEWESGECQALVEIELLGVAHTFPGLAKPSLIEAYSDAARRVLWYLQCPGYEDIFEPDLGPDHANEIREPPANWMKDKALREDDKEVAEKKTVLMRLQNRLQQNYSRHIEVGKSAISWTYERNTDKGRPQLVRATAYIPAADRRFTGAWKTTQREAQFDVCHHVSEFLDVAFPPPSICGRCRSSTN